MTLLDTNVMVYASTRGSPHHDWARQTGQDSPRTPLPDFFIGAHAQIMAWPLATADTSRFRTYFPSVQLMTP